MERKKEHFDSLTKNKYSGIANHILKTNHTVDWNNFHVIDTASNDYKLTIKEAFHIKEKQPAMNDNTEFRLKLY